MASKCAKCGDTANYNFALNIGLCDPCIGERIEDLEAALQRIDNWAKAYPLKAFPEPDLKRAAEVLKAAGMTLDAISADAMRHVLNGVKDIIKQALGRDK